MTKNYIILILYLFSLIHVQSSTSISFSSDGDGYSISDNVLTITGTGEYDLTNSYTNKEILVSSSCTLNLNGFTLVNDGTLTPIIIGANQNVEIKLTGDSSLTDSSANENEGIIYLQSGASLTISGTGSLVLNPNKLMAINGTDSTSLTVNDGASITVQSSSTNAGGVYLRTSITFNNALYTYSCTSGENHAIDTEGTIKIVKGTYIINSGYGKGIQSETYLYIGEENGSNSDLTLNITTTNEGIEAKKIEIYSGTINIKADEDGINAASSDSDCDETVQCSGTCACYITFKGGSLYLISGEDGLDANGDITISGGQIVVFAASSSEDQPIDQDGLLQITGGTVLAVGSSAMGGVSATTSQTAKTYSGTINSGVELIAKDSSSNEILSLTTPKAGSYLYFNYESSFSITLDGSEITLSDATSQSSGSPGRSSGGQGGPGGPPSDQGNPGTPPSDQGTQPGEQGNSATVSETESATTASTNTNQTESSDEDPEVFQTSECYFLKTLNIIYLFGLLLL